LGGRGDVTLFVPPNIGEAMDLPLVLLLHGVYGSHWDWTHKGEAHRTTLTMIEVGEISPLVLAMPSDGLRGHGTAYMRQRSADFERWIVQDVVDSVAEVLAPVSSQSNVYISGLSMGGFGALRLGATYPGRFHGISAHSSLTHLDQMARFGEYDRDAFVLEGYKDGSALACLLANRDNLPPLRFDCGRDDPLVAINRQLHQALEEESVTHIYQEFPGGHSWAYWRLHLKDTLRFFDRLEQG
jgi:enterochelin esterase-like enzyme